MIDGTITASDSDNANLTGATVTISNGAATGDLLEFVDTSGITGSWNVTTYALTLSGIATVAEYQAALRTVTYRSTSDDPTATSASRTIS